MSVKYAVVAVDRTDGVASTVEVYDDMSAASKVMSRLSLTRLSKRFMVVPYEEADDPLQGGPCPESGDGQHNSTQALDGITGKGLGYMHCGYCGVRR